MKKIIFLMFLMVSISVLALDYTVFPTRFNFNLNRMNTEEITIINNTLHPVRIQIFAEEDNRFSKEHNLNKNIKIFPKLVSIKPAGKQIVRFRVTPHKEDGEFKSYITFKELERKNQKKSSENTQIISEVQMLAELSIPIYGMGNNIDIDGSVKNVTSKRNKDILSLKVWVESKGNASLKLFYTLKDKNNIEYSGKLGNSVRTGNCVLNENIILDKRSIGSTGRLIIKDEFGKVYYKNIVNL